MDKALRWYYELNDANRRVALPLLASLHAVSSRPSDALLYETQRLACLHECLMHPLAIHGYFTCYVLSAGDALYCYLRQMIHDGGMLFAHHFLHAAELFVDGYATPTLIAALADEGAVDEKVALEIAGHCFFNSFVVYGLETGSRFLNELKKRYSQDAKLRSSMSKTAQIFKGFFDPTIFCRLAENNYANGCRNPEESPQVILRIVAKALDNADFRKSFVYFSSKPWIRLGKVVLMDVMSKANRIYVNVMGQEDYSGIHTVMDFAQAVLRAGMQEQRLPRLFASRIMEYQTLLIALSEHSGNVAQTIATLNEENQRKQTTLAIFTTLANRFIEHTMFRRNEHLPNTNLASATQAFIEIWHAAHALPKSVHQPQSNQLDVIRSL